MKLINRSRLSLAMLSFCFTGLLALPAQAAQKVRPGDDRDCPKQLKLYKDEIADVSRQLECPELRLFKGIIVN